MMQKKRWVPYVLLIGLTLAGGVISGLLSGTAEGYEAMVRPALAPPGWLFPVVWSILYTLMAIGMARVWNNARSEAPPVLALYLVQLAVNLLWPFFFFRWEMRGFAFFWLLLLLILVVWMTLRFDRLDPVAGWLQIPYILWLCFAGYLNLSIWLLNR